MFRGRLGRSLAVIVALIGVGAVLTGCGKASSTSKGNQIDVVTSTDFYGEAARAVLGNKGTVHAIINKPSVDPHDYEPTPAVAKEVHAADVTVANGIGYDSWMTKLTANSKATNIKVGNDLMGKKDGDNPHIWYNPATMPKLANKLATTFSKQQPKNKAYFEKNAQKYIKTLANIKTEIATIKQLAEKLPNKNVYVSEPVFDYALEATGFHVANKSFEEAIENESDPSPKSIATMQAGIKQHKVAFFVNNRQVTSKTTGNIMKLAKTNNVPVLQVTETLPAGKDYDQWMLSQYKQLTKILKTAVTK